MVETGAVDVALVVVAGVDAAGFVGAGAAEDDVALLQLAKIRLPIKTMAKIINESFFMG
jgi:hypothetical protein